jgi:hypothetical protein
VSRDRALNAEVRAAALYAVVVYETVGEANGSLGFWALGRYLRARFGGEQQRRLWHGRTYSTEPSAQRAC